MAEPVELASDSQPLSMNVLSIINDSRMTYGLRHQDFQRYREYCANRVRRLRQILKLSQPNNKKVNVSKPLPEIINDVRYLHLFVFDVERAWSYAMELKQESSNSMETRHHYHMIKRLKRANQYAETLYQLCTKQNVEKKTVLDVKAYASLMKGYLYFEQQNWKDALSQFIETRIIYDSFAKLDSTTEQEALCYATIDQIDPNIRFCGYRLHLPEGQDVERIVTNYAEQMVELKEQLDLLTQSSTKKELKQFKWRNKDFTIKHQDLVNAITRAQQVEKDEAKLVQAWREAEKVAKRAIKENKISTAKVTSSKSAKTTEDLQRAFAFIEYHLFGYLIQRNIRLIHEQQNNQHIIKLYDDILKDIEYIWDLPNLKQEDISLDNELNILSLYYKGRRCVQVAITYADMNKVVESLALYQKAQTYLVQAKQLKLKQQAVENVHDDDSTLYLQVTDADISNLEQSIQSGTWKSRATYYLEHDTDEHQLVQEMEQLMDDDYLMDGLDSYPKHIQRHHLVEFPPQFKPVACKPFYFDLAANFVQYPEQALKERIATKSSGGGFWGLFGGGRK
ncbi:uncharacterized protein BX663DRAFT_521931 [Cokeromyces recurvatus]|uniref:uncharacterized protein n=1 Tax=Cokeromyces recurvatus TaxID=90255 RepID=UPI002220B37B|nr:uncharacterized protein BX663DRAFT_521931 [Cokeromyces recurvatus]KAI7899244.1 hypothetical protein BX663DRAFT_521931 [Cokeromyces recurvatus]